MMSLTKTDGRPDLANCCPTQYGVRNGSLGQGPGPRSGSQRGYRLGRHKDADDTDLTSLRLKISHGAEHAQMGTPLSGNRHFTPHDDLLVSSTCGSRKDDRPLKAWPGYIKLPSHRVKIQKADLEDTCPAGVATSKRSLSGRRDQLPPPSAETTPHKMVYKGRPSAGCENCRYVVHSTKNWCCDIKRVIVSEFWLNRKMKKNCDQKLPACSRCVRMDKACGGYRNISDLMFKNETESVTRRASAQSDPGPSLSSCTPARQSTPDIQTSSKHFFFEHIVSDSHLAFLNGTPPDDFLLKPIMACALAAMANRDDSDDGRALARLHYVDAITATNYALRHPQRVKEDNTLVAVWLLSLFEVCEDPQH